jgi:hypothetical protein
MMPWARRLCVGEGTWRGDRDHGASCGSLRSLKGREHSCWQCGQGRHIPIGYPASTGAGPSKTHTRENERRDEKEKCEKKKEKRARET